MPKATSKHCPLHLLIAMIICFTLNSVTAVALTYNVVNFGAKPNSKIDSTKAFINVWSKACASAKPTTIYVPKGQFLIASGIIFKGPCVNKAISIVIDGTLVAPSDYRVIGNAGTWLHFQYVTGISIRGGVLDGQGTALWNCKNSGKSNCPIGATTLAFTNSQNIVINGLTSLNSQMFHIVFNGCQNVKAEGVNVIAKGNSPNTDGIHVQFSSHVTITHSNIGTGDDCISIGAGTTYLWIENVACGPGHGISIGSLGKDMNEPGVQNVTVKTVTFTGTQNGVRIKSWGRPSNGFVRNILFKNAIMVNVQNPIIIDQNYCPGNKGCPGQASGVKISDVTYENIHGTSATEVAVKFDCSSRYPCRGIRVKDVRLAYKNKVAQASCNHADGTSMGLVQPQSCL